MLSASALSTFKFSDSGFYTLEETLKSTISNKRDSALTKPKVSVGGSDMKRSNSRKNLDTKICKIQSRAEQKAAQLCADIEYNFSTAINALGQSVWDVESPIFAPTRKDTEYVTDSNGKRKRFRRKPEDLEGEKNHNCPYAECEKSYTSRCSLYLHIKRNHQESECLKPGEVAPIRINSKVKKGVNIYKVFKSAQALKYECGATNLSTANSVSDSENSTSPINDCFKRSRHDQTESKSFHEAVHKCDISKKSPSAHNLVTLDFDTNCEIAAENEIFSWEANSDYRRASSTSIFVQEPTNEFENVIEEEEEVYGRNFTFPYNQEYIEDQTNMMDFDLVGNQNYFGVNDNESAEYAKTYDLIDFTIKEENSDCNSLFEFEFELQMNGFVDPRKALKC